MYAFLCCPFKEKAIHKDHFVRSSVHQSVRLSVCLSRKLQVGYNFAISKYFFIKLFNYIAYDTLNTIMPNCSGQGHICWNFAPFCEHFLEFWQSIWGRHKCLTENISILAKFNPNLCWTKMSGRVKMFMCMDVLP